jgi:hypothetical protein
MLERTDEDHWLAVREMCLVRGARVDACARLELAEDRRASPADGYTPRICCSLLIAPVAPVPIAMMRPSAPH